jgi:hypothetical protein
MSAEFKYDISVLLPTRGRTDALRKSVQSLYDNVSDAKSIQIMLGFDRDDVVGTEYFNSQLKPWLDSIQANYVALKFEPMGYIRLNEYVNTMARMVKSRWYIIWNDDAVMQTPAWDTTIMSYKGQFRLLAFCTHNLHPYSIFPIVPHQWLELLGYLCPHQISDAWLSQQAYLLDIYERIPVDVAHERYDLTGNNGDATFNNRPMLEGNPKDPRDFLHIDVVELRYTDCKKLARYMESIGMSTEFFWNVLKGKQDPWEKLKINDVNRQQSQWSMEIKRSIIEG